MTTPGLSKFYRKSLMAPYPATTDQMSEFEIVVANPADTGSKFGVRVLYLQDPGQLGKLRVSLNKETGVWSFEPENVLVVEVEGTSPLKTVSFPSKDHATVQEVPLQGGRKYTLVKQVGAGFELVS